MGGSFEAHISALEPSGAEAAELKAASRSADALLAYAEARQLDLSRDDAEHVSAAMNAGRLEDAALDDVSGGRNCIPHQDSEGNWATEKKDGILKALWNLFQ